MTLMGACVVEITVFTDPACPFAFSAEPARQRLRWHYGEQLRWLPRMIVLTREEGEAEKLAQGAAGLQRRYGMPIDPAPYARPASSEPACRAVVAARLRAPEAEARLLRRLRVRTMAGGLLDNPALIAAAARDAGLDPSQLEAWSAADDVREALQADIDAARSPSAAARALDHKLGGPRAQRRYTAPSYELRRVDGAGSFSVPGFNAVETYEAAIANLAPELMRRDKPASVEELLAWAGEPLATAEVVEVTGLSDAKARAALSRVAEPVAAGADVYWTLPGRIPRTLQTSGYSGTPLVRKLGFKPGMRAHYVAAPDGFGALVGELPDGVRVLARPAAPLDLVVLFVLSRAELERRLAGLHAKLAPDGMLWIAWPKRASKVPTDMTEDVVRDVALPRGLVDVKVCAIDETWSGLKLVIRKELRA